MEIEQSSRRGFRSASGAGGTHRQVHLRSRRMPPAPRSNRECRSQTSEAPCRDQAKPLIFGADFNLHIVSSGQLVASILQSPNQPPVQSGGNRSNKKLAHLNKHEPNLLTSFARRGTERKASTRGPDPIRIGRLPSHAQDFTGEQAPAHCTTSPSPFVVIICALAGQDTLHGQ
jgi:hypothetical protein